MGEAFREIIKRARQQVSEWSPAEVNEALVHRQKHDEEFVLVDVREKVEWNEGYIPGAVHVPRGHLESRIEEVVPDKSKKVVLYCAGGLRSLMAGQTLQQMGHIDVVSLAW